MVNMQDVIARAIDNIFSIAGPENFKLFLPMWEDSGKVRDLLKRDLTFSVVGGVNYGRLGPFGRCLEFNGSTGYLVQDAITESRAENNNLGLLGTQKWGQRMMAIATRVGFVRLKIARIGILNTATVRVVIYTDNAGVPGVPVTNGLSDILACSAVGTSYEWRGFAFAVPPNLQKNQKYWLVMEYVDTTGIDGSNYMGWRYESGVNTYGERRAVLTGGVWTATDGENHTFSLYSDDLVLDGDFTIIAMAKNTDPAINNRYMFRFASAVYGVFGRKNDLGTIDFIAYDSTTRQGTVYAYPGYFVTYGLTFSVAKDAGKINIYSDGLLKAQVAGAAGVKQSSILQPFVIGGSIDASGGISGYWKGYESSIIITKTELSPEAMAAVTEELLCVRNMGIAI